MNFRIVFALACLGLFSSVGLHAELQLVNGYAAIVNDRVITYHQVEAQVPPADLAAARRRFMLQPQALADEVLRLQQDALRGLIESELILHEFETAGYKFPESLIEEQLKDRIREEYGSRAKFIQSLRQKNETPENYRRRIREEFIVTQLTIKNVYSPIIVSPHKIQMYYEENKASYQLKDRVRLRMISLPARGGRDANASFDLAASLQNRLKDGTPFKDLATQYSEDANRAQGGDWGWVERGQLREDLEQVAFALKPGEPSDVVRRDDGCYIMMIDEMQPAHTRPLAEVRDEIEETLRRRERARLRKEWLDRLREKSFVKVFAPR